MVQGKPFANTYWFFGGYLLVWVAFALVAALAQWAVQLASLLTPMMESASAIFGSALLIAAGLYQWSLLKDACLRQCQAPLQFIQRNGGFRRDAKGSLGLGIRHGAYCVGCCWALMTLLFVGGVMNLLWIAVLTIFWRQSPNAIAVLSTSALKQSSWYRTPVTRPVKFAGLR